MDNFTIKKVADAYAELGSVRKTAKALGLCRETVIKSLVTYGVYPMGKCADANRLRIAGWSKMQPTMLLRESMDTLRLSPITK